MLTEKGAEERLAELIWRTIKLRVSLLVLTIFLLLIVWSGLINGDKRAQEVDAKFCQQFAAESDKELPRSSPPSAQIWCTPRNARNYIEGARSTKEILLLGSQVTDNKDAGNKLLQKYNERVATLAEYDSERRAAYLLQIQLPSEYSGSNVILNGQFVAKLVPFFFLIMLSVIILLGFQQAAYKQQLTFLLNNSDSATDRRLTLARGQFFAGVIPARTPLISRYLFLTPEKLATGSLYVLLLALFFTVLITYVATIIDLTDSIFVSYPFAVYGATFVIGLLLIRTRRYYIGLRHSSARAGPRINLHQPSRKLRWLEMFLAVAGFLSLCFPWATGVGSVGSLMGFDFLGRQVAIRQVNLGQSEVVAYPLDPRTFLEAKVQVYCALLFILICAINAALRERKIFVKGLGAAQGVLAVIILFLSLNYLLYMAILQFGGQFANNPLMSDFLSPQQGYPMLFYNPAYGFLIFLACCFTLIWLSLRPMSRAPHLK